LSVETAIHPCDQQQTNDQQSQSYIDKQYQHSALLQCSMSMKTNHVRFTAVSRGQLNHMQLTDVKT